MLFTINISPYNEENMWGGITDDESSCIKAVDWQRSDYTTQTRRRFMHEYVLRVNRDFENSLGEQQVIYCVVWRKFGWWIVADYCKKQGSLRWDYRGVFRLVITMMNKAREYIETEVVLRRYYLFGEKAREGGIVLKGDF